MSATKASDIPPPRSPPLPASADSSETRKWSDATGSTPDGPQPARRSSPGPSPSDPRLRSDSFANSSNRSATSRTSVRLSSNDSPIDGETAPCPGTTQSASIPPAVSIAFRWSPTAYRYGMRYFSSTDSGSATSALKNTPSILNPELIWRMSRQRDHLDRHALDRESFRRNDRVDWARIGQQKPAPQRRWWIRAGVEQATAEGSDIE